MYEVREVMRQSCILAWGSLSFPRLDCKLGPQGIPHGSLYSFSKGRVQVQAFKNSSRDSSVMKPNECMSLPSPPLPYADH